MKQKTVAIITAIILLFSFSTIYAAKSESNQTKKPFISKHIILSESGSFSGNYAENVFEIWINKNGYFKSEVISGPNKGDYTVWDGLKLYQFTHLANELYIRKLDPNDKPIPHPFLSSIIYERIKKDISKGKLKKSGSTNEYMNEFTDLEGKKKKTKYVLNDSYVENSSFVVDGKITSQHRIKLMEDFEPSTTSFEINKENVKIVEQP